MKKIFSFILFLIVANSSNAQLKKKDSLLLQLKDEKTDTGRLKAMLRLGAIYERRSNDSALLYYQNAFQLAEKTGNVKYQIQARSLVATYLFAVKYDYPAALDLYLQNIKKEQETGDTSNIIWDTRGALFVYENVGDYSKSLEYANQLKSLVYSDKFKGSPWLSDYKILVDFRLGVAYGELKRHDIAKKYFLGLYNSGLARNVPDWSPLVCSALGDTYANLNNADSALYYYRKAMPLSLAIKRADIYVNNTLGMSNLYWKAHKADSAYFYAVKSYRLAKEYHLNDLISNATSLLGEIYYFKKRPDSAYLYLKQSQKWKDSLLSSTKLSRVENLTTNESLQKMQDEETKKQAVNAYKSSIKIYSLLVGFGVLAVFLIILYRNNLQRKTANEKLGKAYDNLKATQTQLIQSEKMASLGELTAGIAHEIQNPLNFVNNFSDVNREMLTELKAESAKPKAERDEQLAIELIDDLIANETKINHHGKRADAIVKGMLQHSRATSDVKEPTDINKLADEYLRLAYHGLRAKNKEFNAELVTHFDDKLPMINIVPQDIGRVVLNIINNAFYATQKKAETSGPDYKPTVEVSTAQQNGSVLISIKDNGSGIPENIREKIMQPFFTTKPTGEGTGLGLSLSYDIVVKGHSGKIDVESKEGEGSEFVIAVPITN